MYVLHCFLGFAGQGKCLHKACNKDMYVIRQKCQRPNFGVA